MFFFPHLGIFYEFLIWASRSKGVPPGPVTPLASLVHAKGNPHVFLDLEVRCESGGISWFDADSTNKNGGHRILMMIITFSMGVKKNIAKLCAEGEHREHLREFSVT